jgi:WD40 repeat protein
MDSIIRGSVTAKPTRAVRLWDWNSGKELPSLSFPIISDDQVRQFILAKPLPNPEGFNDDLSKIRINQARGVRDSEQVAKILFSPDGRKLAAAYGYHGVVIWNLDNREMLIQTGPSLGDSGLLNFPLELAFSPDGRSLAAGWNDGDLGIIDLDTRKEVARWTGMMDQSLCLLLARAESFCCRPGRMVPFEYGTGIGTKCS